jgi:hypothetical protein
VKSLSRVASPSANGMSQERIDDYAESRMNYAG